MNRWATISRPFHGLHLWSAGGGMTMNTIRVMLTLAAVAIASATTASERTLAGGQNRSGASELAGTTWKTVRLQAGEETTLVPGEGSKNTITFQSNGRAVDRDDFKRGSRPRKTSPAIEM